MHSDLSIRRPQNPDKSRDLFLRKHPLPAPSSDVFHPVLVHLRRHRLTLNGRVSCFRKTVMRSVTLLLTGEYVTVKKLRRLVCTMRTRTLWFMILLIPSALIDPRTLPSAFPADGEGIIAQSQDYFPDVTGNRWQYRGQISEGPLQTIENKFFSNVSSVTGTKTLKGGYYGHRVSRYQSRQPWSLKELLSSRCSRHRVLRIRAGHDARTTACPLPNRPISHEGSVFLQAV